MKIPVRKEGFFFYGVSFFIGIILLFFNYLAGILLFVLTLFFLWFFRDPERKTSEDGLVSPADGKVMEIDERDGENFIAIFMSPFNVHVNRSPISGKISKVEYKKGKKLPANKNESSHLNESNSFTIENQNIKIIVKQIAGILARRIVSFKKEGENVEKGERIGLIKFGSRVEVFLPKNLKVVIKKGEKIYAGSTIIAKEEKA